MMPTFLYCTSLAVVCFTHSAQPVLAARMLRATVSMKQTATIQTKLTYFTIQPSKPPGTCKRVALRSFNSASLTTTCTTASVVSATKAGRALTASHLCVFRTACVALASIQTSVSVNRAGKGTSATLEFVTTAFTECVFLQAFAIAFTDIKVTIVTFRSAILLACMASPYRPIIVSATQVGNRAPVMFQCVFPSAASMATVCDQIFASAIKGGTQAASLVCVIHLTCTSRTQTASRATTLPAQSAISTIIWIR
jgi:hypothetical protein